MRTTARLQQRYDHRLRDRVHRTGDVTIATDLGVPRSTARGWLRMAPEVVVSLDVTHLSDVELYRLDPLVAAYFAAAKSDEQATSLAVWAINLDFSRNAWADVEPGIRVVEVPRGSNPFLHPQSGLFCL